MLGGDAAGLNPLQMAALGAYLAANDEALNTPVSDDATPMTFVVSPGDTAGQVAQNLATAGLISDAELLRAYLVYHALDTRLEAGTYRIAGTMTIPEIAAILTSGVSSEISIRITEGWRREQVADWMDEQAELPFNGAAFLWATDAGASLPADLLVSQDIPPGASLEGFLFPDTYQIALDATATDLVLRMLRDFDMQVTSTMRADATNSGLTMYQVVTLASIVEREAVIVEERPIIASVYLNRLALGMNLEADPTVQYAMGYQALTDQWWNLNLTAEDYYAVDSPYNTYLYSGLPPGPIASPGLGSIIAVIYPADTPYLFFRAACDGSGAHVFTETFEEHQAYACP